MGAQSSPQPKKSLLDKLGFHNRRQLTGFLSIVFTDQVIYDAFDAFKGPFYNVLLKMLHLNNTQLGLIFSLIGISVFFYIPGGWINNRFSVKSILITSMMIRMFTTFIVIFFNPNFTVLEVIATIWGITDAVFWPAVLNGVNLLTDHDHKSVAFGLMESIRRLIEMSMNMIMVGVMALSSSIIVFKGGMLVYDILLLPLSILIGKYVPTNGIAAEKKQTSGSKGVDAFKGLLHVFKIPKVWAAAIIAMTIYWSYVNAIYTIPYLQAVFKMPQAAASLFGTISTSGMGIVAALLSGILADNVFHSTFKLIFIALAVVALSIGGLLLLPQTASMAWLAMILILIFTYGMFTAKGIMMVPVSKIDMPEKYRGSAMSVCSFGSYSPKLFAYALNGAILDAFVPIKAYRVIFTLEIIAALFGAIMALCLMLSERKQAPAAAK